MSILHTVNKSPFEKSSVGSCLAHALEGSSILFYEDAVYAVLKGASIEPLVAGFDGVKLYALGADLKARGITDDKMIDGIEIVDYAGFVDLSAEHDKVQAWV
ncbi:MAG: sulfurtransferase complex subunit TusB [Gammaproteobacteria bacterium]|nr:sulfurtransferase complex subunit TusB [Gammaproteobacteria bacterium]